MSNGRSSWFRRPWRPVLECLLLIVAASGGAAAQAPLRTEPAFPAPAFAPAVAAVPFAGHGRGPAWAVPAQSGDEGERGAVFVAALGTSGLGGFLAGAAAVGIEESSLRFDDPLLAVVLAATAGSSLGAALGADLADSRDGTFVNRLLMAGMVGAAGFGFSVAANSPYGALVTPLLQAIAMAWMGG